MPGIVKKIAPKGSLAIHEEAWNAYPYCKTVLTNPDYMKDNFYVKIETIHLPDRGTSENVILQLTRFSDQYITYYRHIIYQLISFQSVKLFILILQMIMII